MLAVGVIEHAQCHIIARERPVLGQRLYRPEGPRGPPGGAAWRWRAEDRPPRWFGAGVTKAWDLQAASWDERCQSGLARRVAAVVRKTAASDGDAGSVTGPARRSPGEGR